MMSNGSPIKTQTHWILRKKLLELPRQTKEASRMPKSCSRNVLEPPPFVHADPDDSVGFHLLKCIFFLFSPVGFEGNRFHYWEYSYFSRFFSHMEVGQQQLAPFALRGGSTGGSLD